jgi:hypothetical protein
MSRTRSVSTRFRPYVITSALALSAALVSSGVSAQGQAAPTPPAGHVAISPATAPAAPPPRTASATPGSPMSLDLSTLLKAKPGTWADYTMSGKGESVTIRYSLVEHTADKLALEINMPLPKQQGEMVSRFDFVPKGPDAWKLTKGQVQMGPKLLDMPKEEVDAAPLVKVSDTPGDLMGTEDVTTPLGKFSCKHYKKALTTEANSPALEMWISDKASPTGIVKQTLAGYGIDMVIAAVGNGATSKFK